MSAEGNLNIGFMIAILVTAISDSHGQAQSLKAEINIPTRGLVRLDSVGAQELGFHIGYEAARSESWNQLLQRRYPGYSSRIDQTIKLYEQLDEFPVNHEFQFCELSDGRSSLLVPEGMFVIDIGRQLLCHNGQVLVRRPASRYIERIAAPSRDRTRSVQLLSFGTNRKLPLRYGDFTSASRLIHRIQTQLDNEERLHYEYLLIKRVNAPGEFVTIVLPALIVEQEFETYYDHFLNLPLEETDQISFIDRAFLMHYLQTWTGTALTADVYENGSRSSGRDGNRGGRNTHHSIPPFCFEITKRFGTNGNLR